MNDLLLLPLLLIQDGAPAATPAGATPQGAPGTGPAAPPSAWDGILGLPIIPLVLCFGVFWLLILRPEAKQRKKRAEMLAAIKKGDRVLTSGGMHGTVVQVQDDVVTLQVDEGVRLRFAQSAIGTVLGDDGQPLDAKKK